MFRFNSYCRSFVWSLKTNHFAGLARSFCGAPISLRLNPAPPSVRVREFIAEDITAWHPRLARVWGSLPAEGMLEVGSRAIAASERARKRVPVFTSRRLAGDVV
jgi:hypothetical protein